MFDSLPLVTDADFFLTNLDSTLFPGISSNIEVHNGFGDAQARWVHFSACCYTVFMTPTVLPRMSLQPSNLRCLPMALRRSLWLATLLVRYNFVVLYLALTRLDAGAAISLLDSVYLPLWLPAGTTFRTIGYGLPRVRWLQYCPLFLS
jgi:hypothetical protein